MLLANGKTKAIDQIKVGDEVKNAVPGVSGSETHKVERVIVTTTDHDFVDLKIAPKRPGKLTKAAVALAAGVAALAGTAGGLTTFHHPFYDRTQAAFVEAKDLNPDDRTADRDWYRYGRRQASLPRHRGHLRPHH